MVCLLLASGLAPVTKQTLVVATVPEDPNWVTELLSAQMGEPGDPAPPAPKVALGLVDSRSVSLPPYPLILMMGQLLQAAGV